MSYYNPIDVKAEELSDLLDLGDPNYILELLMYEEILEFIERARGDNGKEEQELMRKELHQMAQNI